MLRSLGAGIWEMVIFTYINKKTIFISWKTLKVPSVVIKYLLNKICHFDFLKLASGTEIFYLQALQI